MPRNQISKLKKGKSTKAERKFMEILKSSHIPFKTKVRIGGREVDFLIGNTVIEIDSHRQDVDKNIMLYKKGYEIFHLDNNDINERLGTSIKQYGNRFFRNVYQRR